MSDWCDYWNAEWRKKYDKIKSKKYKTKMEGNTVYVLCRRPVLFRIICKIFHVVEQAVCTIPMCKLKESELINELKKYGFKVGE